MDGLEVATRRGRVHGLATAPGVRAFLGIPFARPPVGALRLLAPEPAPPWTGVRDATAYGPAPPQSRLVDGFPAPTPQGAEPDDWLTLNIWTPWPVPEPLPVLLWLHGGAYLSGASSNPALAGDLLARDARLVVVSANYRLGPEGYAVIRGSPSNRGLLDQLAALRWVAEEAGAFGGDPERIVLAGQSAGAGSVAALLGLPETRGLVRRAVAQSVPRVFLSHELAERVTHDLAAGTETRATRSGLSELSPRRLAALGDRIASRHSTRHTRWGALALSPTPWGPVVDHQTLMTDPWAALRSGAGADLELLVTHTRDEYRLFTTLEGPQGPGTDPLRVLLDERRGTRYREEHPDLSEERLRELVMSDWLFRMPSLELARAHRGLTYLGEFTLPASRPGLGAAHGTDVPLVLGHFIGGTADLPYGSPPDRRVRRAGEHVRAAWAAFAHTGDPGWPRFEAVDERTQVLDDHPRVTAYPEAASARIWAGTEMTALHT